MAGREHLRLLEAQQTSPALWSAAQTRSQELSDFCSRDFLVLQYDQIHCLRRMNFIESDWASKIRALNPEGLA